MRIPGGVSSWRGYVGLTLVWLAVLGVALLMMRKPSGEPIEILPPPTPFPTTTPGPTPTARPLRVDVGGAVRAPGVYVLPADSIVTDAIAAAGGASPDAALDLVNQAAPLQDGMQIRVPSIGSAAAAQLSNLAVLATAPAPAVTASGAPATLTQRININTATLDELESLPGIGPALAQSIVEERPFGQVEDLLRVNGIGPERFEKLKDLVSVQ